MTAQADGVDLQTKNGSFILKVRLWSLVVGITMAFAGASTYALRQLGAVNDRVTAQDGRVSATETRMTSFETKLDDQNDKINHVSDQVDRIYGILSRKP